MSGGSRVLVVGAGYIAGQVGRRLAALGHHPVLSSRHRPDTPGTRGLDWLPADVLDHDSLDRLLATARPDLVVTVHGPSDITWCEANPDAADAAHHGGASRLAALLEGRRALMISTDNVFPGDRPSYGESDPTAPANAYGRAKLAAERALLATGDALALRVSLVYGWDTAGLRPNFFTTCALRLAAGQPVSVPDDHWNTPVLADDVAAWAAALLTSDVTGVLHLGGPTRLSRLDWARHIARAQGADPALARPAPRDDTAYACRPRNACLHSERAATIPELEGLAPVDVRRASTRLIAAGKEQPP